MRAPARSATRSRSRRAGIEQARRDQHDVVIVDTAGRLAVDADLMQQAADIRAAIQPDEVLFVIDAMIGQAAVETAQAFQEGVDFTGVVLSKLDGDARGGAALSVASVTGRPIMFASTGEGVKDFEVFHPDRMASRILDMGDVLTLIEQAEKAFDRQPGRGDAAQVPRRGGLHLRRLPRSRCRRSRRWARMKSMLGMMPGMGQMKAQLDNLDEREFDRIEAMVRSMTPFERTHPKQINGSRRARIAKGSGVQRVRGQPAARALQRGAEDDEAARPRRRHPRDAGHARAGSGRQAGPPAAAAAQEVQVRQPGQAGGRGAGGGREGPAAKPAAAAFGVRRGGAGDGGDPPTIDPGQLPAGLREVPRAGDAARAPACTRCSVGTAGPRVAFLHGLFGQGRNWTQIAKALAGPDGTGARCLLVDLPDHGRSPWTQEFSFEAYADAVAATLRGRRRRASPGCSSGTRSAARSPWCSR